MRHNPKLSKGNKPSVKLIETYVRTIAQHWPQVESGQWRLAMAVMAACPAANQLKALAQAAAGAGANAPFREDLAIPRRHSNAVRNRLTRLDEITKMIVEKPGFAAIGIEPAELTWRVLAKLSVLEPRLEGADRSDRTAAVERLMPVTPDGTTASADRLYSRLAENVGDYAPAGARVDFESLSADLRGLAFFKSPDTADEPASATEGISPGLRAEALTLGPIEAIAGLEQLHQQAVAAVATDPSRAAEAFEQVATRLEKKGFRGHATLLRARAARQIEGAGHLDVAACALTTLIENLIQQGAEHVGIRLRCSRSAE